MAETKTVFHPIVRIFHYLSEFVTTFLFMFFVTLAILVLYGMPERVGQHIHPDWLKTLGVLIVCFCSILLVVYSPLGKISGAHFNPVVTFAFWMENLLDTTDFVFYVIMQMAGALIACSLLQQFFPEASALTSVGLNAPAVHMYPELIIFTVEFLATSMLISIIFTFLHNPALRRYTGFAVASYVVVICFITSPVGGLSMNPIRSLSPAIVSGHFDYIWIYILAPLSGAYCTVHIHRMSDLLHCPKCYRLNHQEGYIEKLFERFILHQEIVEPVGL